MSDTAYTNQVERAKYRQYGHTGYIHRFRAEHGTDPCAARLIALVRATERERTAEVAWRCVAVLGVVYAVATAIVWIARQL